MVLRIFFQQKCKGRTLFEEGKKDYFHAGFGSFVDKRLMPASSENDVLLDNPCALDSEDAPSNQQCASNFCVSCHSNIWSMRNGSDFFCISVTPVAFYNNCDN
jgi:hypothetical protein